MSQFDNPYANAGAAAHGNDIPRRTSGLAVASLVCSLVCCIPALPAIGAILGLGSLVAMGRNVMLRGRGLAIAGIVLGVLMTVGHVVVIPWLIRGGLFVANGPHLALSAGVSGDVAAFKSNFHGAGATAPDAEAQAFLEAITARYGAIQGFGPPQQMGSTPGDPVVPFRYSATFANGTVDVDVEIAFSDKQTGGFFYKINSIAIRDPDKGDLSYPPASGGGGG